MKHAGAKGINGPLGNKRADPDQLELERIPKSAKRFSE
ncbi:hypothetical protein CES85_4586 [Ochrobactrum quorumnocens]|uniref:Uncharacterized protein n=1 Tax=Ochrobactrum quorumnocens TaxID=271865 RepID=A0A248UAJ3_9HYPH|nr:hypothetical protein CES85_4586 [[Ochrobactrum] quorumnocens]